ncbi:MAG: hypothetical protein R3F02_03105 [Thiolinea sp.]
MSAAITINGDTRLFPILGDPISQVRSPQFLSGILAQRGENALVPPLHVRPEDLSDTVAVLKRTRNIHGIVITVPHKISILEHCDVLSERAEFVGSANILRRGEDGRWLGDNTDGIGYVDGILHEGFEVSGKRVLLIGVGGAGAAVALEFVRRGVSELAIHDLSQERRDRMVELLNARYPGKASVVSADPAGFDLVANVTPVGMKEGDPYPVEVEKLQAGQFVAEAITKPAVSPLVAYARQLGCNTMVGAGMFDAQAEILVDFMQGRIRD